MARVLRVLFLISFIGTLSLGAVLAKPPSHAFASSFTIDGNFRANAEQSVQGAEPGYIPGDDCTHWISYFLNTQYGFSTNLMRDVTSDGLDTHTDDLISDLLADGDAQVVSGDQNWDSGAFVDPNSIDWSGDSNSLDANMIENGGNEEFIVAFHWYNDPYPGGELASHLAIYVGNGQVISHGAFDSKGNEADGMNRTPAQSWSWFSNIQSIAIIALTNSANGPGENGGTTGGSGGYINPGAYDLGPVDLNGYCQSNGYAGVMNDGGTAYNWYCVDSSNDENDIDMDAACAWQYADASNVSGYTPNINDPYSWQCYGQEIG